jgi:hypothetical protein
MPARNENKIAGVNAAALGQYASTAVNRLALAIDRLKRFDMMCRLTIVRRRLPQTKCGEAAV